jgi:hypothetical protein
MEAEDGDWPPEEIGSWLTQIEDDLEGSDAAVRTRLLQELDEIAELLVGRHDLESEELKTRTQALIVRVDPDRGSRSEA